MKARWKSNKLTETHTYRKMIFYRFEPFCIMGCSLMFILQYTNMVGQHVVQHHPRTFVRMWSSTDEHVVQYVRFWSATNEHVLQYVGQHVRVVEYDY